MINKDIAVKVEKTFKEYFNKAPLIVRSPGRVNLIGEHTDYNMGYVLPAAIDKSIYFAIAPCHNDECRIIALDMNDEYEFPLNNLKLSNKGWPNYLMGIVDQMMKARYKIEAFNCVFGGDIPIGAGMSSSAAIEAGLAFSLNYIFQLNIDKIDLVKLAQKAENEFVGVKCGIMDQYINIFGKDKTVLKIDCRTLENEYYPFDFSDVSIVLFDTSVSHSLASSEYNKRRAECMEGVKIVKNSYPKINSLRDVSIEMLNEHKKQMDEIIFKRCKYVIEENCRVVEACVSLEKGDLKSFGRYMRESHIGLSNEYQVSCYELDFLVDAVKDSGYVYGARMMGAGFGGCTINIIENEGIDEVIKSVSEKYRKKFDKLLKVYVTSINSGTNVIKE